MEDADDDHHGTHHQLSPTAKAELNTLLIRIKAIETDSTLLVPLLHSARTDIEVLKNGLHLVREEAEARGKTLREATSLALASIEKATALSQTTADKAVAKAEAAADKALLEQMIAAVRNNFGDQIQSLKESILQSMLAAKEAVHKAETATEKRFEGVNEFRAQLQDQAQRFMPRAESESQARSTSEKIDMLTSRLDRIEGRTQGFASGGSVLAMSVGIVGTVIAATIAILALNN